jgi:D-methionine transport system ATP-binding protein
MSAIEIRHLTKRFEAEEHTLTALDDVNLSIASGTVYGIIGMSGAGKSTLVRSINFLEKPSEGQVLIDGVDLSSLTAKQLRKERSRIGMIFQGFNLLEQKNVIDNVCFPMRLAGIKKKEAYAKARELLKTVALEEKEKEYPSRLSGGQKQRVALVRAMMMHPEILLLDEITAALDPEMVSEVLNVVIDLARSGMTMAIVTHEMRFAEAVADQVLFLEDGVVVEQGTPEQFFHMPQTERAQQFLKSFTYTFRKSEVQPKNNSGD